MTQDIDIRLLCRNEGQINGLPRNPRFIRDEKFDKLKKSIEENPEMLSLRELLVYPLDGKYIVIGGNMRLEACKALGYKTVPCKVLDAATTVEQLKAYTVKDNAGFGEWDWDALANEWDGEQLADWGVDVPEWDVQTDEPKSKGEIDLSGESDDMQIAFKFTIEQWQFVSAHLATIAKTKEEALLKLCGYETQVPV